MELRLPQNLEYLRLAGGFTQMEAATRLGLKRSTYVNYERGGNEPDARTLLKIASENRVSVEDLLTADLSQGKAMPTGNRSENRANGKLIGKGIGKLIAENGVSEPPVQYGATRNNVYDLDSRAAAGQALLLLEEDKRLTEPNMYIPNLGFGLHVRLPIGGDSMAPAINDGDRPVGTHVPDLKELRPGTPVVLIDVEEGIVCKRAYFHAKRRRLELVSINRAYGPYERDLDQVLAVFKIQEVHKRDFDTHGEDWRPVVDDLRAEIADLRRLMKG